MTFRPCLPLGSGRASGRPRTRPVPRHPQVRRWIVRSQPRDAHVHKGGGKARGPFGLAPLSSSRERTRQLDRSQIERDRRGPKAGHTRSEKLGGADTPDMPDYGTNTTADLCRFVAEASYDMLTAEHVEKLKDLVVDHVGIAAGAAAGAESSAPFLEAVQALHGNTGRSTVYTKGAGFLPQWAGFLNAAYAHTFDFDDTHAASILVRSVRCSSSPPLPRCSPVIPPPRASGLLALASSETFSTSPCS